MRSHQPHWPTYMPGLILTAVALAINGPAAAAQQVADSLRPSFASASVRRAASGPPRGERGIRLQPGGVFSATGVTLRELIAYAYQRHPLDRREITGGPGWIDSVRFDVRAAAADEHWIEADGAPRRTWAMLRTLLTERFRLRLEESTRQRHVYVLTLAGNAEQLGPRIQRTEVDCGALMRGQVRAPERSEGPPCGTKTPPGRLVANTVTMPALTSLLSSHLDRPVIDGTGLAGRFDVQLEAREIRPAPDYRPGPSDLALPPAAGPSMFVAVREQLGLELEPRVAAVPVLVVRRAEHLIPR